MLQLWKNVAATSLARMYSLVVSLFLVMIVARWLGPSGQGAVAAATAWATLFGTLGSLSLGQVATHRATVRRGEPWLHDMLGTLLLLAAVITAIIWLVAVAIYLINPGFFKNLSPLLLFVAFWLVPFVVWEFYGSSLLVATDQLHIYNRAQLIGRSVALALMFGCWMGKLGTAAALLVSVISQAIVACTGLTRLWHLTERRLRASVQEARALLNGAVRLHLNTISGYILTSVGVLIVNNYCSSSETGWYNFSSALLNVMAVIPLAAAQVLSGHVAQYGPDGAWPFQRRVMVWLPLLMIVGAVVAAICAPYAIPLVVGAKYRPAVPVFRISLFGLLGMTFSALMASQWIGRGYFTLMSILSLSVAVIYLSCAAVLVPRYGMFGAVYANLVTQVISIFGNGILALRCEATFRAEREAIA